MEIITRNISDNFTSTKRIEALKQLTKLLLREVEELSEAALPLNNQIKAENLNLTNKVQQYERNLIWHALIEAKGNQRKAAKILGTKTSTLHAKIRRYEIDLFPDFEDSFEIDTWGRKQKTA